MPPRRGAEKSRQEMLTDVLIALQVADKILKTIDLRATGGQLRSELKAARADTGDACDRVAAALALDTPRPMTTRAARG